MRSGSFTGIAINTKDATITIANLAINFFGDHNMSTIDQGIIFLKYYSNRCIVILLITIIGNIKGYQWLIYYYSYLVIMLRHKCRLFIN
jgi:hypothetical protein